MEREKKRNLTQLVSKTMRTAKDSNGKKQFNYGNFFVKPRKFAVTSHLQLLNLFISCRRVAALTREK